MGSPIDPLTRVPTRATLEERLESSFMEWVASDSREQYTLVLFDADYFKAINDLRGKTQGDSVLKELGFLFRKAAKEHSIGIFGRYGGEEFLFAVPNKPWGDVYAIADRLRRSVHKHAFMDVRTKSPSLKKTVTITLGARVLDPTEASGTDTRERLFAALNDANIALDYGKVIGKNRVARFSAYLHKEFELIENVRHLYFTHAYKTTTPLFSDCYLRRNPQVRAILRDHFRILQRYVPTRDTRTQAVFADNLYTALMNSGKEKKTLFADFVKRRLSRE